MSKPTNGGSIFVSRSLWDDCAFADERFSEREAWVWMIAEASWKAREVRSGKFTAWTERGQFAHSVRYLAEAWKWSKSRVHRFLGRLEKRDMIGTHSGTGLLLVTICNYDEYQGQRDSSGTPSGREAGQQRDSSGTEKKKDEIRGKSPSDSLGDRETLPLAPASSSPAKIEPQRFEEFWGVYPHRNGRKVKRKDAEEKYARLVASGIPESKIIDGAWRAQTDEQVQRGYSRDPTTWLNQRGWEDEIAPADPHSNVTPFKGNRHDRAEQHRRESAATDEFIRRVKSGEIQRGPDPSDPFAWG